MFFKKKPKYGRDVYAALETLERYGCEDLASRVLDAATLELLDVPEAMMHMMAGIASAGRLSAEDIVVMQATMGIEIDSRILLVREELSE